MWLVTVVALVAVACGSDSGSPAGADAPPPASAAPAATQSEASEAAPASAPSRFTEQIEAKSQDGVLFDIQLTYEVHDQNGNNSRRDDVEVLAPDLVEYQGLFPSGDGDLLIVSCFAPDCQDGDLTAIFEISYWVSAVE